MFRHLDGLTSQTWEPLACKIWVYSALTADTLRTLQRDKAGTFLIWKETCGVFSLEILKDP